MKEQLAERNALKLYNAFIMPIIMLLIRIEIDVIFQITYDKFFNNIGASGNK